MGDKKQKKKNKTNNLGSLSLIFLPFVQLADSPYGIQGWDNVRKNSPLRTHPTSILDLQLQPKYSSDLILVYHYSYVSFFSFM